MEIWNSFLIFKNQKDAKVDKATAENVVRIVKQQWYFRCKSSEHPSNQLTQTHALWSDLGQKQTHSQFTDHQHANVHNTWSHGDVYVEEPVTSLVGSLVLSYTEKHGLFRITLN